MRVEELSLGSGPTDMPYDYVLGRAVTDLQTFVGWGKRFYSTNGRSNGRIGPPGPRIARIIESPARGYHSISYTWSETARYRR